MKKEITLQEDVGTAKAGTVFIRGLHGIPDYYKDKGNFVDEDWYWQKGTKKEDLSFLYKTWFNQNK